MQGTAGLAVRANALRALLIATEAQDRKRTLAAVRIPAINGSTSLLNWRSLAVLGAALLLLALAMHPATAAIVAAAVVLLPVALFGNVLVPLSLGAVEEPQPGVIPPVMLRARLFQRPPPISLR